MPTSVPGSKHWAVRRRQAGFTLLELLIVITVIALSTGLSVVALRDSSRTQLEQEASRLAAMLDAARVESRVTGRMVTWRPTQTGTANSNQNPTRDFVWEPSWVVMGAGSASDRTSATGAAAGTTGEPEWPSRWLHEGTTAEVVGAARVVLGPEPLIPPQRIRLQRGNQQVVLTTDGLGGFRVESSP